MTASKQKRREPRPRADALLNRERIMVASCEAFTQRGAGVALDEIDRRAALGNATLYRHFVNRRELIRTVVLSLLSRTADQAEAALATEPTPLGAVRRFLRQAVDEHFGALCPMLGDYSEADDQEIFRTRSRLEPRSRNSSSQPNTRAAAVGLLIPDWLYEHSVWFHAGCLGRSALRDLSGRAKEPVLLKAGHSHDVDNHVVRNAGHRR
ncbi:TetR/AcrR family transcriptional regulator [Streptomyces sp. ME01-24h]|nr:TetR/AcrR family transcriptional regulator [Streptomyces sp. ME01-24h]